MTITLNDLKIIEEILPEVQRLYTSGKWDREQTQKALGYTYGKLTSDEGRAAVVLVHDGLEEKKGHLNDVKIY